MSECIKRKDAVRSAIIILGASGDLARRKLIPALAKLYENGSIDDSSIIVGSGRSEFTDDAFRGRFGAHPDFAGKLYYHRGIAGLKRFVDSKGAFDRYLFFMALPPAVYASTAAEIAHEGFSENVKIVIEKPFGYNFASARQLNQDLARYFDELQLFRIDHYLAKEAVQNILVFRFANTLFNAVWNSNCIDSIFVNASETIGIEQRGEYFDKAGIIRDMVQNHLMQLLCLMTMEAPATLDAEEIRYQKLNVLKTVTVTDCVRYQYRDYTKEKNVAPDSTTETYAELRLIINNFRWAGMPVYLRAGKALDRTGTEIGVKFKQLPKLLFNESGALDANKIVFKIQPDAGIIVDMSSKLPGGDFSITNTSLNFCYRSSFSREIPEAYQKLLLDALRCDRTLFISNQEAELSWQKLDPILDTGELYYYEKGTMPPPAFKETWIDFQKYQKIC